METKLFRTLWLEADREQRERWAEKIGTTYKYLQAMSGGFKTPSIQFALRMEQHIKGLDINPYLPKRLRRTKH